MKGTYFKNCNVGMLEIRIVFVGGSEACNGDMYAQVLLHSV